MYRVLVLLSGGMDSATAVAVFQTVGNVVETVSFNYGQRHNRELLAAKAISDHYQVKHHVLDLSGAQAAFQGSALTSPEIEVPHGHYEDGSMKLTVVPNRNMIMLALATGLAISRGMKHIVYGAHAGDHAVYPDCRPEFYEAMQDAISKGNYEDNAPKLIAPFIDKTKADIAKMGSGLNVPFEMTWSCYEGNDVHCGQCGTCVERIEAFELAGVEDPTQYASH